MAANHPNTSNWQKMEKYESKIKVVKGSPEAIFSTVSDLSRIKDSLPAQEMVKDVESTAEECTFTIDKIGRVSISVMEKTPCSLVKYALKASMPLGVNLFVQIKNAPEPATESESRIKVTLTADIPMMLKPLVGNKLQDLVDKIADTMSRRQYY